MEDFFFSFLIRLFVVSAEKKNLEEEKNQNVLMMSHFCVGPYNKHGGRI